MPLDRTVKGGLTDKIAKLAAYVKDTVEGQPDMLFSVRELTQMLKAAEGKPQDGYLIAIAIGLLSSVEEVTIEKRAGRVYVGSK